MNTRNRNILVLILSLAIGGGFLYYVLNFNKNNENRSIRLQDFVADSVDGYAFLEFNQALPLIREEISAFPNGTFALLGINQFENTELDIVKKEEGIMGVFYADTANISGFLFAQLKDSLIDLQQSGFVYKKSLYADRVHIGQYKNLMVIRFTKNEESMTAAVASCESYLKSKKKSGIVRTDKLMNGKLFQKVHDLSPDLPHFDSLSFSTSFKKSIELIPYINGASVAEKFKPISYAPTDTNKTEIAIQSMPDLVFYQLKSSKKIEDMFKKAEKVGFDMNLIKDVWNGKFILSDFGTQKSYTEFITYEMDDEFNTVEVVKREEKQVKAFSCFIGTKPTETQTLLDDLEQKKILKKNKDSYTLLNMFDAQIFIYDIPEKGLFITNFQSKNDSEKYVRQDSPVPSFIKTEQLGKTFSIEFTDRITVRYE